MNIVWLLQIVRSAIVPLAIVTFLFLGYNKVRRIGYQEAATKYEQIISDHVLATQEKLANLEKLSTKLVQITTEADISNAKNIGKISASIRGKSLVILKDGQCNPSPTFLGSFEEINRQANESMKGFNK